MAFSLSKKGDNEKMKLTTARLKKLIREEMEQMESLMSGLPGDTKNYPSGAEKFGVSKKTGKKKTYNMMNGRLGYVDSYGNLQSVDLTGPNGESCYYEKDWLTKLESEGYTEDPNLTAPA